MVSHMNSVVAKCLKKKTHVVIPSMTEISCFSPLQNRSWCCLFSVHPEGWKCIVDIWLLWILLSEKKKGCECWGCMKKAMIEMVTDILWEQLTSIPADVLAGISGHQQPKYSLYINNMLCCVLSHAIMPFPWIITVTYSFPGLCLLFHQCVPLASRCTSPIHPPPTWRPSDVYTRPCSTRSPPRLWAYTQSPHVWPSSSLRRASSNMTVANYKPWTSYYAASNPATTVCSYLLKWLEC